jgi:hypothetical protein
MTYQLFIGSNNATGQLELDKLEQILSSNHSGFTIVPATGYWQGAKEDSVAVIISDTARKVHATIRQLKAVLQQDAIAWQRVAELQFS